MENIPANDQTASVLSFRTLSEAAARALAPFNAAERRAIRSGDVRVFVVEPTDGDHFPKRWSFAWPWDEANDGDDRTVRMFRGTREGLAGLIVGRRSLRCVPVDRFVITDEEQRERIAEALADAMLREVP